jgi:hypothetical protein
MKRAFFEWSWLVSAFLSVACVAYWGVSVSADLADVDLSFGRHVQMLTTSGRIAFCGAAEDFDAVDLARKSSSIKPKPTKVYAWDLPGVHFTLITFKLNSPLWSLNVSLLVPIAIFFVIGVSCFRRYRRLVKSRLAVLAMCVT